MRAKQKVKNADEVTSTSTAAELTVNGQTPDIKAAEAPRPKPQLWEFLADPERDTDDSEVWLYRLQPIIDRKQGEHCICKRRGRFDRSDILRDFGSGLYEIYVNNARGKTLYRDKISFHNLDYPPRVDPHELVAGDPRNARYLEMFAKPAAGQGNRESGKGETAEILREVFERGAKIDPELIGLWREASAQRDALAKLLAEQKQTAPAPPPPQLSELLSLAKQLQSDPISLLGKLKEFFPAPGERERPRSEQPPPDPLDNLQKMLSVFEKARDMFKPDAAVTAPVAAAPDAELWEKLSIILGNQISGIMASVPGIIAAWKGGPVPPPPAMVSTPASAPRPGTGAFDPYANPEAARDFMRMQNAVPPVTSAEQPSGASGFNGATVPPADQGRLADVAVLINQALGCLNRGVDGHRYAGALIDMNGDLTFDTIVEQIKAAGVPAVIQMAKSIPPVSQQATAYEAPLQRFIEQFVEGPLWEDEPEGGSAESESEPARRGNHKQTATVA